MLDLTTVTTANLGPACQLAGEYATRTCMTTPPLLRLDQLAAADRVGVLGEIEQAVGAQAVADGDRFVGLPRDGSK